MNAQQAIAPVRTRHILQGLPDRDRAMVLYVVEQMATGRQIARIFREDHRVLGEDGLPIVPATAATFWKYAHRVPELSELMDIARKASAAVLLDEAIALADGHVLDDRAAPSRFDVKRAKLQVETRLRAAAMFDPQRYNTKGLDVTSNGQTIGNANSDVDRENRAASILAAAALRAGRGEGGAVLYSAADRGAGSDGGPRAGGKGGGPPIIPSPISQKIQENPGSQERNRATWRPDAVIEGEFTEVAKPPITPAAQTAQTPEVDPFS